MKDLQNQVSKTTSEMLIEAIEQSDTNKKPVNYQNKTVRQFISQYEALFHKEKSLDAEDSKDDQAINDAKAFQFSRQYRPLIKILAERQKVTAPESVNLQSSSTQTIAKELILENIIEEDVSNKSMAQAAMTAEFAVQTEKAAPAPSLSQSTVIELSINPAVKTRRDFEM